MPGSPQSSGCFAVNRVNQVSAVVEDIRFLQCWSWEHEAAACIFSATSEEGVCVCVYVHFLCGRHHLLSTSSSEMGTRRPADANPFTLRHIP